MKKKLNDLMKQIKIQQEVFVNPLSKHSVNSNDVDDVKKLYNQANVLLGNVLDRLKKVDFEEADVETKLNELEKEFDVVFNGGMESGLNSIWNNLSDKDACWRDLWDGVDQIRKNMKEFLNDARYYINAKVEIVEDKVDYDDNEKVEIVEDKVDYDDTAKVEIVEDKVESKTSKLLDAVNRVMDKQEKARNDVEKKEKEIKNQKAKLKKQLEELEHQERINKLFKTRH